MTTDEDVEVGCGLAVLALIAVGFIGLIGLVALVWKVALS